MARRIDALTGLDVVTPKFEEEQMQILRLTTPKLKGAWGPVRSG
jgi:hypothetical protein